MSTVKDWQKEESFPWEEGKKKREAEFDPKVKEFEARMEKIVHLRNVLKQYEKDFKNPKTTMEQKRQISTVAKQTAELLEQLENA